MPNELMKTLTIGANTYDLPQKTSDLTNDSGFITSETDPTVPSWAKASSKPTYTASEVGAATSSHTHGNITNGGDITTNATIASGDRIVINDESASKITNSSVTFGSSTTQYLANNGTWQNIPTIPTKTSDLTNDSGFITSESDPVFTASAAHGISSSDISAWNAKSDFSGSYNDLSDKPTIPDAVTESTVAGWGFTKNTGTYSKPSGGIPKTDLASAVQTSLGKADTALQSYTESDPIFTASAAHGITSTDITNWNNKISEPASEGTNGQVLMTNGSGTRTWGSVSTADEKIKLTSQSTSGNYPLIFGPTSITSNSTYQGYYNTGITINPNTKAVTATTFVGALTGTASGNLTSSSTLDASKLSGAIPSTVTATTQTSTDNSTKIATTAFVQTAIDNLPEPMVFKGSLGTGGTITSLPTASTSNTGYTYKVITAGTYASQSAKIGDTFISDGSAWILIPSGDEPSGTVTSITLNATSPISIDSNSAITTSGTRTLSHADSGVTAGTYKSVTVDSKGHVTAGSNPSETDPIFTSSVAYGISSSDITNWNGKTSNTGTVTSVRVQATSPVTSSVNTAQGSTLDTTIALADGYGDTKNPYASKTKNYVLAAPSNANGTPSFRALVADDIPSLTKSKISDFPTIPTKTSDLTNDSGFVDSLSDLNVSATASEINILDGATISTTSLNQAYQGIPYGAVDNTSTSTVFTATVDGITSLIDGTCVMLRNGVVTSESGFTLNVNNLGAKPVYNSMAAATADTTIFNVNYTMLFVYDSTRVSNGCWVCYRGYNSNDNTIGYQIRHNSSTLNVTQKTYRYRLLFSGVSLNTLVPANASTSTSSTAAKTVNSTPINPFGPIYYYGYTSAVSANASPSAVYLWQQYPMNLGYSFTNATALALTSKLPVFLKCAPQNDGSAIIDSTEPIVQALPLSADGKIYIFLGIAYSETNIELCLEHPIFYHDGTNIKLYTGPTNFTTGSYTDINGNTVTALYQILT